MKTYLFSLLLLWGLLPITAFGQVTLQDSLVVYYPFDGNALDNSGNNNHGIPNGAVLTTDRFGTPNSAYFFDGINDEMVVTSNQKLKQPLPVTMTAWVEIASTVDGNLIFKNDFQENVYHGAWLNLPSGTGRLSGTYGNGGGIGPQSRRSKNGTTLISTGIWWHLAAVVRGPLDMSLYVNGREDCGTYSGSGGSIQYTTADGKLGVSDGLAQAGPLRYFHGKMDEIRFYNRALSKTEIQELAGLAFLSVPDTICAGDSVSLDGGQASSYAWSPAVGLSCTTCPLPVAFPGMTTTYQLITTNASGCPDTSFHTVEVEACAPVITCDSLGLQAGFASSVNFMQLAVQDVSVGNVDSIHWDWGDGSGTSSLAGVSLSHTYALPGNYQLCQTIWGSTPGGLLCADTLCESVAPSLPCDSLGLQAGFASSVNFMQLAVQDVSVGNVDSIHWDWGDGSGTSSLAGVSLSHTYVLPGNYQLCQTIWGSTPGGLLCADTLCESVVLSLPCDSLFLTPDFQLVATFLEIEYSDISGGDISSISWDFGDGTMLTDTPGTSISHLYALPDTYLVCLTITGELQDGSLCPETFCQEVIVTAPMSCSDLGLQAAFTAITSQYTTDYEDFSVGFIDSLQWIMGDGITYVTPPGALFSHTYTYFDTFPACLVVYGHLFNGTVCTDTACLPVIPDLDTPCDVIPIVADFGYTINGLDLSLTDGSYGSQVDAVNWNLDGINWVNGAVGGNMQHSFPGAGLYPVCLEAIHWYGDTLACRDTMCEVLEIRLVGREERLAETGVVIFPHPFEDQVQIRLKRPLTEPIQLRVYDLRGRLMQESWLQHQESSFSTQSWPSGMYLLHLSGPHGNWFRKLRKGK